MDLEKAVEIIKKNKICDRESCASTLNCEECTGQAIKTIIDHTIREMEEK